jgi:hypothetical protein
MRLDPRCLVLLCAIPTVDAASLSVLSRSDDPSAPIAQIGRAPDLDASGRFSVYVSPSSVLDGALYAALTAPIQGIFWPCTGDQLYVHDAYAGEHILVSRNQIVVQDVCADGAATAPSISPGATRVAWLSTATNMTGDPPSPVAEVFVARLPNPFPLRLTSTGTGVNEAPDVADDGAVVYVRGSDRAASGDSNGQPDVYLLSGGTERWVSTRSVVPWGASGPAREPAISGDGRFVVFESIASDLTFGDTNAARDVYLYATIPGAPLIRVSDAPGADQVAADSDQADIDASGRFVVFRSEATNMVSGETAPMTSNIYLYERTTRRMQRVARNLGVSGYQSPSRPRIAPNGDYVVFEAVRGGSRVLLRWERVTEGLSRVADLPGLAPASTFAVADSGRDVVFDNLVALAGVGEGPSQAYRARFTPGVLDVVGDTAPRVDEGGVLTVQIERTGGTDGAVDVWVALETAADTAAATFGRDFGSVGAVPRWRLSWEDGESGIRNLGFSIADDDIDEDDETLRLRLIEPGGDARIGPSHDALATIIDDD